MIKGAFPTEILDQDTIWIDPQGQQYRIDATEDEEVLLWGIDYLLANSRFLREAWATKGRKIYDTDQRARRWMLEQPLTKALMRKLVELWQTKEQEALDEAKGHAEQLQGNSGSTDVGHQDKPSPFNQLSAAWSHTLQGRRGGVGSS